MRMYSNWSTHICLSTHPGHKAFRSIVTLFLLPIQDIPNTYTCTCKGYQIWHATNIFMYYTYLYLASIISRSPHIFALTRKEQERQNDDPFGRKRSRYTPLKKTRATYPTHSVTRDGRSPGTTNGSYSTNKKSLRLTCIQWHW